MGPGEDTRLTRVGDDIGDDAGGGEEGGSGEGVVLEAARDCIRCACGVIG